MSMRRSPFWIAIVTVMAVIPYAWAKPGEPQALQITKPIYQWKTESGNDKKGFNHCLVKNMYDNGIMMIVAQNREDVTRLALHFPQDKMKMNQHFDLSIQIDKGDTFPVEAAAVNSRVMTIGIPEALPDRMRHGQALYLRGPTDEVVFTLEGMDGAIAALRDCVSTNRDGKKKTKMVEVPNDLLDDAPAHSGDIVVAQETPRQDDKATAQANQEIAAKEETNAVAVVANAPVRAEDLLSGKKAPAKAPVQQDKSQPEQKKTKPLTKTKATPSAVKEKPPVVTSLLPQPYQQITTAAGVLPERLLLARQGLAGNKPLDFAWVKDGLFMGIKQEVAMEVASVQLPQLATRYLASLRARCGGEFVAEASAFERLPANRKTGGGWILAEVACAAKTLPHAKQASEETIGALLFLADEHRTSIYFVEGPTSDAAQAIKSRNKLLDAFLTMDVF